MADLQTYNQLLNAHALKSLYKNAVNPDFKLAVGEGENLFPHTNAQLGVTAPVSKALIEPRLEAIEDRGLVGDGQGVLSDSDFDTTSFDLGLPIVSEVM